MRLGPRAARRRGRCLRGATERHDRLLGALPQVGQCDRAPRLVHRRSLERCARAGGAAGGGERRLPEGSISIVTGGDRDELREIATRDRLVDLVIPRGGEGLKAALKEHATVPVMYAAAGNCHVYVDGTADLDDAVAIAVNAKVQRPGVCNAAETLLVHAAVAADFLPRAPQPRAGRRASGRRPRPLARRGPRRLARRGDRGGLGDRVPRADPRGEGGRLGRRGDRAREPLQLGALGGDHHRLDGLRPGVHRRRGRGVRLRQRLHPLHRRRRVRDGRRDRQLHAEAARARPDRGPRAHHLQVRDRGSGQVRE